MASVATFNFLWGVLLILFLMPFKTAARDSGGESVERILAETETKDLVVLGLNHEALDVTHTFFGKQSPAYPMLIDGIGEIQSLYGVGSLPVLVLLDRSGNILAVKRGCQTYEQMDKLLEEAGL